MLAVGRIHSYIMVDTSDAFSMHSAPSVLCWTTASNAWVLENLKGDLRKL
jgi:hypothetical protein